MTKVFVIFSSLGNVPRQTLNHLFWLIYVVSLLHTIILQTSVLVR